MPSPIIYVGSTAPIMFLPDGRVSWHKWEDYVAYSTAPPLVKSLSLDIVALDPSLNNFGIVGAKCLFEFREGEENPWIFINPAQIDTEVSTYKKPKDKPDRKVMENILKASQHFEALSPYLEGADYVFAEAPYGSQSYSAAVSYGVCSSILGSVVKQGIPLELLTAMGARKKVFMEKELEILKAAKSEAVLKKELVSLMARAFPTFPWPYRKSNGEVVINWSKAEHLADAFITLLAGLSSPKFIAYVKTRALLQ